MMTKKYCIGLLAFLLFGCKGNAAKDESAAESGV